MSEFKIIGKPIPRHDAWAKVQGDIKYADDFPSILNLYVFRSKISHAIIKSLNISNALKIPGVYSIIMAKDIPGQNLVGSTKKDRPILADKVIRYRGEAIALIVARDRNIAELASEKINLKLDILKAVFDPIEAIENSSIKIHEEGNILAQINLEKGDTEREFKKADLIVESQYRTAMTEHAYLEPNAGVGEYKDGILTIEVSTQSPYRDREEIALLLNLPLNRIRVIQAPTGGAFGGKRTSEVSSFLALAVYKTKQRIKMLFSREEEFCFTTKRHPFIISLSIAADKKGKLLGLNEKIIADTGAYAFSGPAVLKRALIHATGPYNVPNIKVEGILCYTNNIPASAMRGFGVPQVNFAMESQMDILAKKLDISPIMLRLLNCLVSGGKTATGQVLKESVGIKDTILTINERMKNERVYNINNVTNKRRGIGCACMWYGIGKTSMPNPSTVWLELLDNGKANLYTGCADIGQGSTTILRQIAAEELDLPLKDIAIITADTQLTPDSGPTAASRQTYITGKATQNACKRAKEILFKEVAEFFKTRIDNLKLKDKIIYDKKNPSKCFPLKRVIIKCRKKGVLHLVSGYFNPKTTELDESMQGIPYATYGFGTQCALIEVDIETGQVKVLKIIAAHDVGRAINPLNVEGQIEGGCVMGMGQALLEELVIKKGKVITPDLAEYLIPTALDVPEIETIIIENEEETGPFGAKGMAECTNIPTMAAISNAISNAIGIRIKNLPITAENILQELKKNNYLF